jgi:polysaccharide pyruvyl transferase WcaK-like protein
METLPRICYVGWHAQGNLGDDAIREAVEKELNGASFVDLPLTPRAMARSMLSGLPFRLSRSTLVLGGGTCIGRRNWRHRLEFGLTMSRSQPGFAIGVGVEDPSFNGYRSYSDNRELRNWPKVLDKLQSVSVRGPLSAELLSTIGIDAPVVGDPALLLPRPNVAVVPGRVGVNVGFGDDIWGHNPDSVADQLAIACETLEQRGYQLFGVLMNEDDRKWLERSFSGLRGNVEYTLATNSSHAIAEFAKCSAVVVTRLHAAVLAAISATPMIALEYQPKCRDFAMSIKNEDCLIRTDAVSAGEIVDRVVHAMDHRVVDSTRIQTEVDRLREHLTNAYDKARANLGLVHY